MIEMTDTAVGWRYEYQATIGTHLPYSLSDGCQKHPARYRARIQRRPVARGRTPAIEPLFWLNVINVSVLAAGMFFILD